MTDPTRILSQIEQQHERERRALTRILAAQVLVPPRRRSWLRRMWRRFNT